MTTSKENIPINEIESALGLLDELGVGPDTNREMDILLHAPRKVAESVKLNTGQRMFGALPYLEEREEIFSRIPEEFRFFKDKVDFKTLPAWKQTSYVEGLFLYEIKFGERLSDLAQKILSHYPNQKTAPGRKISVFGLSGSGKSTVIEAMKQVTDSERTVFMDSDTVRYNLLAKKFKDTDGTAGASIKELQQLIHNRVSGALYLALEYIIAVLRGRGYDAVISATAPSENSDCVIYVEHRSVDTRKIKKPDAEGYDEKVVSAMARELFLGTEKRRGGGDNYDWDNAETITDFRQMKEVLVRVPEAVHRNHLKMIGQYLLEVKGMKIISNPEEADHKKRMKIISEQLSVILSYPPDI